MTADEIELGLDSITQAGDGQVTVIGYLQNDSPVAVDQSDNALSNVDDYLSTMFDESRLLTQQVAQLLDENTAEIQALTQKQLEELFSALVKEKRPQGVKALIEGALTHAEFLREKMKTKLSNEEKKQFDSLSLADQNVLADQTELSDGSTAKDALSRLLTSQGKVKLPMPDKLTPEQTQIELQRLALTREQQDKLASQLALDGITPEQAQNFIQYAVYLAAGKRERVLDQLKNPADKALFNVLSLAEQNALVQQVNSLDAAVIKDALLKQLGIAALTKEQQDTFDRVVKENPQMSLRALIDGALGLAELQRNKVLTKLDDDEKKQFNSLSLADQNVLAQQTGDDDFNVAKTKGALAALLKLRIAQGKTEPLPDGSVDSSSTPPILPETPPPAEVLSPEAEALTPSVRTADPAPTLPARKLSPKVQALLDALGASQANTVAQQTKPFNAVTAEPLQSVRYVKTLENLQDDAVDLLQKEHEEQGK